MQNVLFRKSSKYAVTGLSINQNTDNLIEATDINRKKILQELTENLLKEEKEDECAFELKIYNPEGHEKIISLTKKAPNVLPLIKFSYYSPQTKNRGNRLLRLLQSSGKFRFEWEDTV